MPSCLIIEQDGYWTEQIRSPLAAEGWSVLVASDPESLSDPRDPVDLVFVSSELPRAAELLNRFGSRGGRSRSIGLAPPEPAHVPESVASEADEVLRKPFTDAELWALVRSLLSARMESSASSGVEKLTSKEIFGDMLEELSGDSAAARTESGSSAPTSSPAEPSRPPAPPRTPAPTPTPSLARPPAQAPAQTKAPAAAKKPRRRDDDIDRKLEMTLSGVLGAELQKRRKKKPPAPASRSRSQVNDVDKLLSDTLSGLELPGQERKARKRRPVAPEPELPTAQEDPLADLDLSFLDDAGPRRKRRPAAPKIGSQAPPQTGAEASPAERASRTTDSRPGPPVEPEVSSPRQPQPSKPPTPEPQPVEPQVFEAPGETAEPPREEPVVLQEATFSETSIRQAPDFTPGAAPAGGGTGPGDEVSFDLGAQEPPVEGVSPFTSPEGQAAESAIPAEDEFDLGEIFESSPVEELPRPSAETSDDRGEAEPREVELRDAEAGELQIEEPVASASGFEMAGSGAGASAGPEEEPAEPPAEEPRPSVAETRPRGRFSQEGADREFGHYTLLDKIAVGGMAEVWKARMDGVAGFQKTVAIKKILPHLTENKQFERMFVDEARLAAELNHPNITHIYDLGVLQGDYYIAMEYVEGKNLRNILNLASRKGMPIPQDLALLIASRLASALDYAHRKRDADDNELGLVHRDVSPQNVLISYEGDIKLCDFGIVKAVSKLSQTEIGALKGKLQYMSPEQAWGRPVDSRSDIFSLGSLLFEMLTGLRLFAGDTELAVLESVRGCKTRRPRDFDPSIPPSVDELVAQATAEDPENRFQRADRMRHEIESILEQLTLRPSNADLAAFIRRLLSAPDASETADGSPTGRIEPVAHFAVPDDSKAAGPAPGAVLGAGTGTGTGESTGTGPQVLPASGTGTGVRTGTGTGTGTGSFPPTTGTGTGTGATIGSDPAAGAIGPAASAGPFVEAVSPVAELPADEGGRSRLWLLVAAVILVAALGAALYFFLAREPSVPVSTPVPAEDVPEAVTPADEAAQEGATTTPAATEGGDPQQAASTPGPSADDLLAEERERMREEVSQQLAAQEERLRKTYEEQQQRLQSQIQQLQQAAEEDPANAVEIASPGPGVEAPVLVSIEKPQYPAGARSAEGQKELVLYLLVTEDGSVEEVRQAPGSNPGASILEGATRAARTAVFKPATKNGRRVKMWTTLKIPLPTAP